MRSNNLTISVPHVGECAKGCPYCVSKMTGEVGDAEILAPSFLRNINKVKEVAKRAGVMSVMFTSKKEPLAPQAKGYLFDLASHFDTFPKELQTNGEFLTSGLILKLAGKGFNIIAISVDNPKQLFNLIDNIKLINETGMIVRLTINMSDLLEDLSVSDIFNFAEKEKVRQIIFRHLSIPEGKEDTIQADWIREHVFKSVTVNTFHEELSACLFANGSVTVNTFHEELSACFFTNGKVIRQTVDGVNIIDMFGISVAYSKYCVQESNYTNDIRSLVFLEDGHLYTSWNSKASILF